MKLIYNNDYKMQDINKCNTVFTPDTMKCVEVDFVPNSSHKSLISCIGNAQETLVSLERSLRKSNKYEQKLMQCKNTRSHSHDNHKWWDSDQSEQKSFKCSNRSTSLSSSSKSGDQTESWSTMSVACLQYQYKELTQRYEALLQAYDDQCSAISGRDLRLAQLRQRANLTQAQLAHAHKALLSVGEKYLALRRKRNIFKSQYEDRLRRMKNILHKVIEKFAREQLRFDAKLSYCMSAERNSDAALLLNEIRKCNLLVLENMRLKAIIEEVLPGSVDWKKY